MHKHLIVPFVSALAGAALLSGCASSSETTSATTAVPATTASAPQGERAEGNRGEWNREPEAGMTKEQVRARYGDPESVVRQQGNEVWVYRPRVRSRDFIPVYGGFTQQYKGGEITFGSDNRVAGYKWGRKRWGAYF